MRRIRAQRCDGSGRPAAYSPMGVELCSNPENVHERSSHFSDWSTRDDRPPGDVPTLSRRGRGSATFMRGGCSRCVLRVVQRFEEPFLAARAADVLSSMRSCARSTGKLTAPNAGFGIDSPNAQGVRIRHGDPTVSRRFERADELGAILCDQASVRRRSYSCSRKVCVRAARAAGSHACVRDDTSDPLDAGWKNELGASSRLPRVAEQPPPSTNRSQFKT
jgi:hypothetical protein